MLFTAIPSTSAATNHGCYGENATGTSSARSKELPSPAFGAGGLRLTALQIRYSPQIGSCRCVHHSGPLGWRAPCRAADHPGLVADPVCLDGERHLEHVLKVVGAARTLP